MRGARRRSWALSPTSSSAASAGPEPLSSTRLVLVRHGETEWSGSGRHTSHTDLPLTEHGREQAAALTPALAGLTGGLVLSSPRRRATETAELAGLEKPALREDLSEWEYGELEGLTNAEIIDRLPGWVLWDDGCPGGETAAEVGERADRVIAEARAAGGEVVLVAHGHLLRVLAARWLRLPPADGRHLLLGTATLSVLGDERGVPAIERWNLAPGGSERL